MLVQLFSILVGIENMYLIIREQLLNTGRGWGKLGEMDFLWTKEMEVEFFYPEEGVELFCTPFNKCHKKADFMNK